MYIIANLYRLPQLLRNFLCNNPQHEEFKDIQGKAGIPSACSLKR